MRAAVLLLPAIAAAAVAVASAPPGHDPYGNDAMMVNSVDLNALDYNVVGAPTGPEWAADGNWVYGGTEDSGANWYIDLRASDLEARPMRVVVRADDAAVESSRYGFTERELTIDCPKLRYRVERTRHYDRNGAAAGPVQPGGGPLVRAADEGIYSQVAQSACIEAMADELANTAETVMNGM